MILMVRYCEAFMSLLLCHPIVALCCSATNRWHVLSWSCASRSLCIACASSPDILYRDAALGTSPLCFDATGCPLRALCGALCRDLCPAFPSLRRFTSYRYLLLCEPRGSSCYQRILFPAHRVSSAGASRGPAQTSAGLMLARLGRRHFVFHLWML
jgi:hypothetical protein